MVQLAQIIHYDCILLETVLVRSDYYYAVNNLSAGN